MSLQIFNSRILSISQRFTSLIVNRSYAKPGKFSNSMYFMRETILTIILICVGVISAKKTKVGKAGPIVERPTLYVEKDPHKLVNYVCGSNIYNDGEDVKVNGGFSKRN